MSERMGNRKSALWISILMAVMMLAGCGKEQADEAAVQEPAAMEETAADSAEEDTSAQDDEAAGDEAMEYASAADSEGTGELISDEEAALLMHVEKYAIEDYYGDGAEYEIYGPKGSDYEDGYLMYYDHGIMFMAEVFNGELPQLAYQYLDMVVTSQKEEWQENERYSDTQIGETRRNGNDRYLIASAQSEDYNGMPYTVRKIYYLDMRDDVVGILWNMEITETQEDDATEAILDDMAKCYGINLGEVHFEGEWADQDRQRKLDEQDVYEPEEGEPALVKADGYQYLGIATLSIADGTIECPAMAPMGRTTKVEANSVYGSMHGVSVSVQGQKMVSRNFLGEVESWYSARCNSDYYTSDMENVENSEIMRMEGFDEAVYFIQEYDKLYTDGSPWYRYTGVDCYMRVGDQYLLSCDIRLNDSYFDDATNIVLQELEAAYGIDLSEYYYEED